MRIAWITFCVIAAPAALGQTPGMSSQNPEAPQVVLPGSEFPLPHRGASSGWHMQVQPLPNGRKLWSTLQGSPIAILPQKPPRPMAKMEPIPTQWPNAKFEGIPIRWPNLKVVPLGAQPGTSAGLPQHR